MYDFDKKWVGYVLCDFLSNSSGHPVVCTNEIPMTEDW
jgi:hypothetical protein